MVLTPTKSENGAEAPTKTVPSRSFWFLVVLTTITVIEYMILDKLILSEKAYVELLFYFTGAAVFGEGGNRLINGYTESKLIEKRLLIQEAKNAELQLRMELDNRRSTNSAG